jgi:hypothetical protein
MHLFGGKKGNLSLKKALFLSSCLSWRRFTLARLPVFWSLHGNFQKAKKPLNFIAEHYLSYKSNVFLV